MHLDILELVVAKLKHKFTLEPILSSSLKGNIWLLGVGKASVSMAESVIEEFEINVIDGMIISPSHDYLEPLQIFKSSHPLPNEETVASSYEIRELARRIPVGDTVIFCLSGGASSLLTIPPNGIEVEELAETYVLLLGSGASIHEMNAVRKHLCEVKGGQLAEELAHTNLITLITSDVPGNEIETIGSGPTVPDSTTFQDAFDVLMDYDLWSKIPESVRNHIHKGLEGDIPETPKPQDRRFENHQTIIVNSPESLAAQISEYLSREGFNTWVSETAYDADVKTVAKQICSKAISVLSNSDPVTKPAALIFYGESTVKVTGNGKGGRNQELALACALSLEGQHEVTLMSLGTDGIDGPTDAAGAIITSHTTLQARKKKLNPEEFLQNNDSYYFHEQMGTLIRTGPTGNNLMDLQVLIIE